MFLSREKVSCRRYKMDEQKRKLYRGTLCVVRREDDRYLMRLETQGINKGCWIFPGGDYEILQDGTRTEFSAECAIRETQEEMGITPLNPKLRALIYFDNRKRIFPGKREVANFDYQAAYFCSHDFEGEFRKTGPEGNKQGAFTYEEATKLPMHPGDLKILDALTRMPLHHVFEGVVVHNGLSLESADFLAV